jgi:CDGSH-type Zn-finger protein
MTEGSEDNEEAASDKYKIRVRRNGPYLVSGRIPLTTKIIICATEGTPSEWREGRKYPLRENYALCRCGQSLNKPFCDETHARVNFDGTETASRQRHSDQSKRINGPALELTDTEILCASARFCHRGGEIWDLIQKSNDAEAKKTAIEDAEDCPSGRLVVWDKKTKQAIEPVLEKSIALVEDPDAGVSGPIWIRGGIPVESADSKAYEIRNRVTLCRCGKSSNKPFCDSSHYPE